MKKKTCRDYEQNLSFNQITKNLLNILEVEEKYTERIFYVNRGFPLRKVPP